MKGRTIAAAQDLFIALCDVVDIAAESPAHDIDLLRALAHARRLIERIEGVRSPRKARRRGVTP